MHPSLRDTDVYRAHPNPTVGGTPGAHWIACSCGWYVMGKPSVRAARRSFKLHRNNAYAAALGAPKSRVSA